MKRGFSQSEAEALVNQMFETQGSLSHIPRHTRGRVTAALDAGDHWNVLIEWELPHLPAERWYDKFDVQNSMRRIEAATSQNEDGEPNEVLEIRSSHDLASLSADARRKGRHSYHVDCTQFAALFESWTNDKAQRAGPLGLMTLARERIWITAAETRQVAAAIAATRMQVALD